MAHTWRIAHFMDKSNNCCIHLSKYPTWIEKWLDCMDYIWRDNKPSLK